MIDLRSSALVPPCTIIVPAHNEEAGLADTLQSMGFGRANGAPTGPEIDLIIACNACQDATATVARHAAPHATVLEIAERGKANAINRALAVARHPIVLVVDADVRIVPEALGALVRALAQEGVLAASPAVQFDCSGATPLVRAFYRVFRRHPYLRQGVGGAGVYGLSAQGRARLGSMPALIADDHFLRCFFPIDAQKRVETTDNGTAAAAIVRPPATLSALIRTERRSRQGDRGVRQHLAAEAGQEPAPSGWIAAMLRAAPGDFLVFMGVKLWVRASLILLPRSKRPGWSTLRG